MADAQLVLELDDRLPRVWFTWCKDGKQQRGAQVTEALTIAAKDGAIFCSLAVDVPYPPASTLGEPPHRRTGEGQKSIRYGSSPGTSQAWVASEMPDFNYMFYHDQEGRPWLLDTLTAHHAYLERVVAERLAV